MVKTYMEAIRRNVMRNVVNAHAVQGLPYSSAVISGGLCFVSGQFGTDEGGRPIGDVEEQTTVALDHLEGVLRLAELNLDDVVRTTVWLRNLDDFDAMNRAYRTRFAERPPARVTIQVANLLFGATVEIDAIAAIPAYAPDH
jgi:2-iminobutanoate/2-iminopropanoate deaminase